MEKKGTELDKIDKPKDIAIQQDVVNIGGSVIGALVGLVLGGPFGAIIGAATSPVMIMTYNIVDRAMERRYERTKNVVNQAFSMVNLTPEEVVVLLSSDDRKTDDFLRLLKLVVESDPGIDKTLAAILGGVLISDSEKERERLLIVGDSIRNMRLVHLQILKAIFDSGGTLKASKISSLVGIPEIELRSVVRDLELRGMIKDCEIHPIEWKLRELGKVIINFTNSKKV